MDSFPASTYYKEECLWVVSHESNQRHWQMSYNYVGVTIASILGSSNRYNSRREFSHNVKVIVICVWVTNRSRKKEDYRNKKNNRRTLKEEVSWRIIGEGRNYQSRRERRIEESDY